MIALVVLIIGPLVTVAPLVVAVVTSTKEADR